MRPKFTCSFVITAVGDGTFLGKYDVMDAAGDVVDGKDVGSIHGSAAQALANAEERARHAVAALEHQLLVA